MEGFIYLIGEIENNNNLYKIGMTKKHKIEDRLKELQTGNGNELFISKYFKSQYPFKVEKMLHRHYNNYHENGEWFKLDNNQIDNFINECQKYEDICIALKDNPFFNKNKADTF